MREGKLKVVDLLREIADKLEVSNDPTVRIDFNRIPISLATDGIVEYKREIHIYIETPERFL